MLISALTIDAVWTPGSLRPERFNRGRVVRVGRWHRVIWNPVSIPVFGARDVAGRQQAVVLETDLKLSNRFGLF